MTDRHPGAEGADGSTQRFPDDTSLPSRGIWVSMILFAIALALWIWLAQGALAWGAGSVVAALWGSEVAGNTLKWMRTRTLRESLGEIVLAVDRYPVRIGEPLHVRLRQQVRSCIRVQSAVVRLIGEGARIETYGIRDRERKVWTRDFDAEVAAVRDLSLGTGAELTVGARAEIPGNQCPSSDFARWWLVVETSIAGCPRYSASFSLEVVRPDGSAPLR